MIDYMNADDDDITLPDDPQFDAWIERAAPMLNVPPATPRDDMWAAIQAKQQAPAKVIPISRAPRWQVPALIAATLLLGIAVDRALVRAPASPAPSSTQVAVTPETPAAPTPTAGLVTPPNASRLTPPASGNAAPSTNDPQRLYRLAAVQTLSQAEALLTAYRASGVAERDPQAAKQLGTWGREVLSSTRLLIDSPAGDDPTLRSLFNDLELVLVQIIRLSGAPLDASERALIDDALKSRDLLPRIRTAVPAGVAGAASDD